MYRFTLLPLGVFIIAFFAFAQPQKKSDSNKKNTKKIAGKHKSDDIKRLLEYNLYIKALADKMREESQSAQMRIVAENIYFTHHDMQLQMVQQAESINISVPTILSEKLLLNYQKFLNISGAERDMFFLKTVVESKEKMKNLILDIELNGSSGKMNCMFLNDIHYMDELRTKGLKKIEI